MKIGTILSDYKLACGNAPGTEALVRARLDAIFLTVLARKKREQLDREVPKTHTAHTNGFTFNMKRRLANRLETLSTTGFAMEEDV